MDAVVNGIQNERCWKNDLFDDDNREKMDGREALNIYYVVDVIQKVVVIWEILKRGP